MKKILFLFFIVFFSLEVFAKPTINEILIKTKESKSISDVQTLLQNTNINLKSNREIRASQSFEGQKIFTFEVEDGKLENTLDVLQKNKEVEFVQKNYLKSFSVVPNDPLFLDQQFSRISLEEGWEISTGDKNVLVAIIDSGIHFGHPDLQNNIWVNQFEIPEQIFTSIDINKDFYVSYQELISYISEDYNNDGEINYKDLFSENSPICDGEDNDNNGYIDDICGYDFTDAPSYDAIGVGDFLDRDNFPDDESNHGTHVSGIIGATSNNGEGVSGICWNVSMMVLRAGFRLSAGSFLQDDDIASAIYYATDMGANLINASWGDSLYSPVIDDACQYAYEHGVIIVAASGNDGTSEVYFPAKHYNTICVGALGRDNSIASFSNYGNEMDIVAPGVSVLSTLSEYNLYSEMSGTSMATPHVTGSLALLLSISPNLSFEEVKSRLSETSVDLGEEGYDIVYGNGLLNVSSLLLNQHSPIVKIDSPSDYFSASDDFPIIGSAIADDFFRYSVTYRKENSLDDEWLDVNTHLESPQYYEEEKENEVLSTFNIPPFFEDGDYILKLEVFTLLGDNYGNPNTISYKVFKHISIDRSLPKVIDESVMPIKKFNKENVKYYIQLAFNEPVKVYGFLKNDFAQYELSSLEFAKTQLIPLENYFMEGEYDFSFFAENQSGLTSQKITKSHFITLDFSSIDISLFHSDNITDKLFTLPKFISSENDFIGFPMEDDSFIRPLKRYSLEGNEIHDFGFIGGEDNLIEEIPLDVGNTNEEGKELLTVLGNVCKLYESQDEFADTELLAILDCYGAYFIDVNSDGKDEIFAFQDMTYFTESNPVTKRVINIYSRVSDYFVKTDSILNIAESAGYNIFYPKIKSGNINSNSSPDLLVGDQDGNIMVFEYNGDAKNSSLLYQKKLPIDTAVLFDVNDYDNDGIDEFCAGGYHRDTENSEKEYWYLEFFKFFDDGIHSLGHLMFEEVILKSRNNGLNSIDFDGDGDKEIILSISPNAYLIDYLDNRFEPIWKGESFSTNNILVGNKKTNTEPFFLMNNTSYDGEKLCVFRPITNINRPNIPDNFFAIPISDSLAKLTWKKEDNTSYKIYFKENVNDSAIFIDSTENDSYQYHIVDNEKSGFFAVSAFSELYPVNESALTNWAFVEFGDSPKISSVKMQHQNSIVVNFDKKIDFINQEISKFYVDEVGNPSSVIITQDQTKALLIFRDKSFGTNEKYHLKVFNIIGINGAINESSEYIFAFSPDVLGPKIINTAIKSKKEVLVEFDEAIGNFDEITLKNFSMKFPSNDKENEIISFESIEDNKFILYLRKDMELSYQDYFLTIYNIKDTLNNRTTKQTTCFNLTEIRNLKFVEVYPNPLVIGKMDKIGFVNLPLEKRGKVNIYNLGGDLVFTGDITPRTKQNPVYYWNVRNQAQKMVSSGNYFYVLEMGNEITRGTIAIVR